jgi:hypothetical protein
MGLRRAWLRPSVLPLLLAAACGYTSEYAPPADGRVRPVWRENRVVVEPSGAAPSAECLRAALELTGTDIVRQPREYGVVRREPGGYWTPRFYGAPIVIVAAGLAPIMPRPPIFLPVLAPALVRPGVGFIGSGPVPGLRLGSGGDSGKALAFLAIIALVVLPIVDIAVAAAPAESVGATAQAIDQVNALNDLMRSPENPCAYYEPPAAPAGGAP